MEDTLMPIMDITDMDTHTMERGLLTLRQLLRPRLIQPFFTEDIMDIPMPMAMVDTTDTLDTLLESRSQVPK